MPCTDNVFRRPVVIAVCCLASAVLTGCGSAPSRVDSLQPAAGASTSRALPEIIEERFGRVPSTIAELKQGSAAVVVATAHSSTEDPGDPDVLDTATITQMTVDRPLWGSIAATFDLRQLGGHDVQVRGGFRSLADGHQYLLFVAKTGTGAYVVHSGLGVFEVSGEDYVNIVDSSPFPRRMNRAETDRQVQS